MKTAKNFTLRMADEDCVRWQLGDGEARARIAFKYLESGEAITIDSLGQNIMSNELEIKLEKVREILPEDFKVVLYPTSQRTEQYRRLILSRN